MLQAGIGRRLRKEPTAPVTRSHEVTHGLTNREERSDGSHHPLGRSGTRRPPSTTSAVNAIAAIAGDRAGRDRHAPRALTDSTDPELPIDRIDPTEPIERIDPAEPMLAIEPALPMDAIEPAEPIEAIEPAEPIDAIDPKEPMDAIEVVDDFTPLAVRSIPPA